MDCETDLGQASINDLALTLTMCVWAAGVVGGIPGSIWTLCPIVLEVMGYSPYFCVWLPKRMGVSPLGGRNGIIITVYTCQGIAGSSFLDLGIIFSQWVPGLKTGSGSEESMAF